MSVEAPVTGNATPRWMMCSNERTRLSMVFISFFYELLLSVCTQRYRVPLGPHRPEYEERAHIVSYRCHGRILCVSPPPSWTSHPSLLLTLNFTDGGYMVYVRLVFVVSSTRHCLAKQQHIRLRSYIFLPSSRADWPTLALPIGRPSSRTRRTGGAISGGVSMATSRTRTYARSSSVSRH